MMSDVALDAVPQGLSGRSSDVEACNSPRSIRYANDARKLAGPLSTVMRLKSAVKAQIGQRTLYKATGEAAMLSGARQPLGMLERAGTARGVRVVSLSSKVFGLYSTHQGG